MCYPSGEMQPLPLVAWSKFLQWKQTHLNAHFTSVNDMKFSFVLLLLFYWGFAAWLFSEL
jgi:hypothetical protein